MHSSNHLNKADALLHLHLVSLRILAQNLTSLYVNAVVVADLVDLGLVVVVFVGFVDIVITGLVLLHLLLFLPCLSIPLYIYSNSKLQPSYSILSCYLFSNSFCLYLILFTYHFLYPLLCFTPFSGVIYQDMAILKFCLLKIQLVPDT